MPLRDLNQQLYQENSDAVLTRSHEQSEYDPQLHKEVSASPFAQEEHWAEVKKELTEKQRRRMWIAISVATAIVLMIGGYFFLSWWAKNAFHQDRVSVYFEGPKEADSTQQMKYIIHYVNDNRVTLKNAEIQLTYSENFQPSDNVNWKFLSPTASKIFIGDIPSSSQGTVELNGAFYAPKDYPIYLHATITFTPSNGPAQLSMDGQIGVTITNSPIAIEVSGPKEAVDGDQVQYEIDYQNLDSRQISGLQIQVVFPQGFKMIDAQPKPTVDNDWSIGNLEENESGKILIQGQINGNEDENKIVEVSVGHIGDNGQFAIYNKQTGSTRIVTPVLTVKQSLDGNTTGIAKPGDSLKYTIAYKNIGTIGLRDAVVTAELKGSVLDYAHISIEGGSFDGLTRTITWKASDVPGLANIDPQAGGEVHFSIPIRSDVAMTTKNDKNFVLSSLAKIDSPDIPTPLDSNKIIGSNKLEVKLATQLTLNTSGFYNDKLIPNAGPIPLAASNQTTFAIHWAITNTTNDVKDAKLVSSLPSGVRWMGVVKPQGEKIFYNPRTNQLIWNIGDVSAGTGGLIPKREVAFQVGIIPQINQIGQALTLVNKSTLTATDAFTTQPIAIDNDVKTTQLMEDPSVGQEGGKVKL